MNSSRLIASRFQIEELIGQGGMGEVYRGMDSQTGQPVAVKALKQEILESDPDLVERFQREGDALRQLNHPNIVKMLAAPEENNHHYLVMEYVAGGSLADLLQDQPQLPVHQTLQIGLDLADALTRAHRLNIIHRDIKPANVLLAEDGTPRLTDFGIAHIGGSTRVTQTGAIVGTYAYLSPEAFNGEVLDGRADVWAFGVMLYEMLAGRLPFEESSPGAILMAIMNKPTPDLQEFRPDVPVALADLIYRMLTKDRNQRIPNVRLVGAELDALIRGVEIDTSSIRVPRATGEYVFDTPTPSTDSIIPRHNLPAQTTPFIGREEELAEITRLLSDPGVRLVTLLGPGGMGKTRLSLEAAQHMIDGTLFPDGVYFVALAPLASPVFIVPTIAEAVHFTFFGSEDTKMQLLDFLREKRLLLVMDNFEHLIQGAGLVSEMLQAAPGLKVLVSSRERLRLTGETQLDVQGMRFPEFVTPADVENYASVQLFVQSARRAQPGFTLNDETAPLVTRISRLVLGMPLGIELAAAWLEALTPQEIVQEVEKSFDFLETELRDVPERHRSIRAVFEYSWNLLTEDERSTFKCLSVFRGGFTREAAEAVAGASLRGLTALVNKSLLHRTPEGRYEIHELLRQYAADRLAASQADQEKVRELHSAYYAELLHKIGPELISRNQKKAMESIEVEMDNVRLSWQYAVEHMVTDSLNKLVDVLDIVYEFKSLIREGFETFQQAEQKLVQQGVPDDDLLLWRIRLRLGAIAGRLGDYRLNRDTSLKGLEIFQRWNAKFELSLVYRNLCYVTMFQGEYDDAKRYGEAGVAVSREINDSWTLYMNLANLGYAIFLAGEYERARKMYDECLVLADSLGAPYGMAFARNNLGEILHGMSEEHEAQRQFEEAYAIFKDIGNPRGMAFTLNNLGNTAHSLGDFDAALRYNQQGLELMHEIGDRRGIAEALNRVGAVIYSHGDYQSALPYHQQARAIYEEIGDLRGLGNSLALLSVVVSALGDFDRALKLADEGLEIRRKIGNPVDIADSLQFIGFLYAIGKKDVEKTILLLDEAMAVMNAADAFDPQISGRDQMFRGYSYLVQRDFAGAKPIFERIAAGIESSGIRWAAIQIYMGLAWASWGLGDYDTAKIYSRKSLRIAQSIHALDWGLSNIILLAHMLGVAGQPEHAVEIISFTNNRVNIAYFMKEQAFETLADMEQRLPADIYAAAIERGKTLDFDVVVEELLTE